MTGAEILDAILRDAFPPTKRTDALTWANRKLAELWDAEEWTFVQAAVNVTVTAGSLAVSALPTDLGVIVGLHRADGEPLTPIDEYRDFASLYVGTNNISTSGQPCAFTVLNDAVFVGPKPSATSTAYLLIHERALTPLADNATPPLFPDAYHPALVAGGKAEGFRLTNAPLAAQFDADFQGAIEAMRGRYLKTIRGAGSQVPAYRPC